MSETTGNSESPSAPGSKLYASLHEIWTFQDPTTGVTSSLYRATKHDGTECMVVRGAIITGPTEVGDQTFSVPAGERIVEISDGLLNAASSLALKNTDTPPVTPPA